ncbi:hypothetical protein FB451DRAFT_1168256 [Mycena latifolia]|nr:hypothetical protein FB451DRAFT_1168256 [Mycena latifolia]
MSPTSTRQIVREFAICASLSFIIILGMIHALLHILHLLFQSEAALRSPLAQFVAAPAVQLSRISEAHTYLLVVFKITIACTVLVFAARELLLAGGAYLGWWGSRTREGDLENGDCKFEAALGWRTDEKNLKRPASSGHLAPIPEVDETLVILD